jgi:hypothetical protein
MEGSGKLHPPADLAPGKNLGTHWIGDLPPRCDITPAHLAVDATGANKASILDRHSSLFYHTTNHWRVLPCVTFLPVKGHMLQIVGMTSDRDVTSWGSVARFPSKGHVFCSAFSPDTTLYLFHVHVPWTKFPQKGVEKFAYLGTTLTSRYCIHNAMASIMY